MVSFSTMAKANSSISELFPNDYFNIKYCPFNIPWRTDLSIWMKKYDELKGYIASHAAIQINENVTIIPEEDRTGFYQIFNAVCADFVKESFPGLLEDVALFSSRFEEARQGITASLKTIEVVSNSNWLTTDPVNGLTRKLFDTLFDLLVNKIDVAKFEEKCAGIVEKSYKTDFVKGYQHWVLMSLIRLMEPDKAYTVPVITQAIDPGLTEAETRPGWFTEDVPDVVAAEVIPLGISEFTPFLVPKIILHSDLLQTFASVCNDLHDVFRKARSLSKKVEWYKVEDVHQALLGTTKWPDLAIYLGETSEELKAVSDYIHTARPDIIVAIMESGGWFEAGKMETVKRHHQTFKPRLGSFIVCREAFVPPAPVITTPIEASTPAEPVQIDMNPPVANAEMAKAGEAKADEVTPVPEDIHILNVGFEANELRPIINAIVESRQISMAANQSTPGLTGRTG
jgi:hypothetical protein